MKSRLKLIWFALWYGRIPFSITRCGPDQTKGYKQRWYLSVGMPRQDIGIMTADDQERSLSNEHKMTMEKVMSRPDPSEQPLVDEFGPDQAPNDYNDRLIQARAGAQPVNLEYTGSIIDPEERERAIQKSLEDRQK